MRCKRGLFPHLEIGKLFVNSRFSRAFRFEHLRFIECCTRIRPQINAGMPNRRKKWGNSWAFMLDFLETLRFYVRRRYHDVRESYSHIGHSTFPSLLGVNLHRCTRYMPEGKTICTHPSQPKARDTDRCSKHQSECKNSSFSQRRSGFHHIACFTAIKIVAAHSGTRASRLQPSRLRTRWGFG